MVWSSQPGNQLLNKKFIRPTTSAKHQRPLLTQPASSDHPPVEASRRESEGGATQVAMGLPRQLKTDHALAYQTGIQTDRMLLTRKCQETHQCHSTTSQAMRPNRSEPVIA